MGTSSERNKAVQLGMSIGTASGRLKKLLMFNMAQRLGEDLCFRCGVKIKTVDEFTVDHKQDWLNNDAGLFWDITNIAFSHKGCNVPNTRHGGYYRRKVGPIGTSWCAGHNKFLPVDGFRSHSRSWNNLYKYCRMCEAMKRRGYKNRVRTED
jgi:HNH endonuclease